MSNFGLAWQTFWRLLREPQTAEKWRKFLSAPAVPASVAEPPKAPAAPRRADALYTLVLLQREGRLIDFLQENIESYDDAQIGAAVRQIHAGCRSALARHFDVKPIYAESEGSAVAVPPGFDPAAVRLTGNVTGEPPFQGTVQHRGWRAGKIDLPERNPALDPMIIQSAEVEI